MKAAKTKVHQPPEGTGKPDGHFHVYVFDVFNKQFLPGKSFDTIDLPFISADAALVETVARQAEYRDQLMKDLASEARNRQRRR